MKRMMKLFVAFILAFQVATVFYFYVRINSQCTKPDLSNSCSSSEAEGSTAFQGGRFGGIYFTSIQSNNGSVEEAATTAHFMSASRSTDATCTLILHGPATAILRRYERDEQVVETTASQYLSRSCVGDIRLGYITDRTALPAEELSVSIAFGVLIYKDVWQLDRLLRAIYRPHHFYCVHVDKKSDSRVLQAVQRLANCFDNVFVPTELVDVGYGEITQVDAELSCMRELLRRSDKWSWYINLTGQEFPLKTMWQLVRILNALNGTSSIHAGPQSWAERERKQPMRRFTNPHNMVATSGATHIVAVRGFVQFAVHSVLAQAFRDALTGTQTPDETFFNTLNNSPSLRLAGAATVTQPGGTVNFINRLKRFRAAADDPPCFSGRYVHNVCIFGVADLPHVTRVSRMQLFANKLHWNFQHLALDCLEWWLTNKTISEYNQFWHRGVSDLPVDVEFYNKYAAQFGPRLLN